MPFAPGSPTVIVAKLCVNSPSRLPAQFSALIKRTALAAWPREQVASLSGDDWLNFLNQTAKTESFQTAPGNRIEELALRTSDTSAEDEQALRAIIANWIRRHRVQA